MKMAEDKDNDAKKVAKFRELVDELTEAKVNTMFKQRDEVTAAKKPPTKEKGIIDTIRDFWVG